MVDYEALYQTKRDAVRAIKSLTRLPYMYTYYPIVIGEEGKAKEYVFSFSSIIGTAEGFLYVIPEMFLLIASGVSASIGVPICILTMLGVSTLRGIQGVYGFNKHHKKEE